MQRASISSRRDFTKFLFELFKHSITAGFYTKMFFGDVWLAYAFNWDSAYIRTENETTSWARIIQGSVQMLANAFIYWNMKIIKS